jgi:hypothetical protein
MDYVLPFFVDDGSMPFPDAFLHYDADPTVIAYYPAPSSVSLDWSDEPLPSPDMLVVRRTGASLEEWRFGDELPELAKQSDGAYVETTTGWRNRAGEAFVRGKGLRYVVHVL